MAEENIVYHYCSLSTFLTIIKKKTLRLTNVLKSNDALERKYAVEECENCVIDTILECIKDYGPENIDLEHQRWYYEQYIKKCLAEAIQDYDEKTIIAHAMCFSKEPDLLSQWRGYADDGRGVSIGFDRKTLEDFFKGKKHIDLIDMKYGKPDKAFQECISEIARKNYKESAEKTKGQVEGNINNVCRSLVCEIFLSEGLKYKKDAFVEENEVRLVTRVPIGEFGCLTQTNPKLFIDNLKDDIHPLSLTYDFMARDNKIVSYFDIGFSDNANSGKRVIEPEITRSFIKRIVIGPKADISVAEMAHVLKMARGLDVTDNNIIKSNASYR